MACKGKRCSGGGNFSAGQTSDGRAIMLSEPQSLGRGPVPMLESVQIEAKGDHEYLVRVEGDGGLVE
jgi:hypothetical protein